MCNDGDETWPSDNVNEWEGNLTPNKSKQDNTHLDDSTTTTTTEDTTTLARIIRLETLFVFKKSLFILIFTKF